MTKKCVHVWLPISERYNPIDGDCIELRFHHWVCGNCKEVRR